MKNKKMLSIFLTMLALVIGLFFVFPIIWAFLSSMKPRTELFTNDIRFFSPNSSFDAYVTVMKEGFIRYIGNSFIIAVVGTALSVAISATCGYALAIFRNDVKGVNKIFAYFLLGTLVPGEVIIVPQVTVISTLGLYNSLAGVILPAVTTTTGIFMYRQFYLSVPLELAESARIDGAGEWMIFSKIMFSLSKSVTVSLVLFSFMWRWNDYILPLLILSDQKQYTIQIAIKSYIGMYQTDWLKILAASIISIVPIIVLYVCLQKHIVNSAVTSGLKG